MNNYDWILSVTGWGVSRNLLEYSERGKVVASIKLGQSPCSSLYTRVWFDGPFGTSYTEHLDKTLQMAVAFVVESYPQAGPETTC